MENIKCSKVQSRFVLASLVLLASAIAFDMAYAEEKQTVAPPIEVVKADPDVPTAAEPEADKGWWQSAKEKYNAWSNKPDPDEELATLRAKYADALSALAFHDDQVDALKQQADKNVAHLESIIDEQNRSIEELRSLNSTMDQALKNYQDKDNSLMFVEGCFVPINTGQVAQ